MSTQITEAEWLGKAFNNGEIEGLFAAATPLEPLRLILSWAATSGVTTRDVDTKGRQRKSVMIADVSTAFFEAPAKRDVCVSSFSKKRWQPEIRRSIQWEGYWRFSMGPEMRPPIGKKKWPSS